MPDFNDAFSEMNDRASAAFRSTSSTISSGSATAANFIKDNPAPWILVAVGTGLAAYLSSRRTEPLYTWRKSTGQDTLQDTAKQQLQTHTAAAQSMFHENPIAVGLVALAAGALLGAAIPTTLFEQERLGYARERFLDEARQAAHEAAEKVQRMTEEAGRSLKDAAEREGLMTDTASA